jgi:hypothetical protein
VAAKDDASATGLCVATATPTGAHVSEQSTRFCMKEKQSSIKIELKHICHNSLNSVAEPHHFYAAPDPAPGKNFDAAPDPAATAPAPTLLYSKDKFLKRTKV